MTQPCEFCGYEFDYDNLGRYGCPNCGGEKLMNECCENCLFSRQNEKGTFFCRRDAPAVFYMHGEYIGAWPSVEPEDWCAKYQETEE
jgi:hypothetical protein